MVYKIKIKPNGTVDRYKARLVAKGYHQVYGIDYLDSFSPVAKMVIVRMFISVATAKAWGLHQLDINNSFSHSYLDEEVYIQPPEGYSKASSGHICKLKRSLYGLKQASRQQNTKFCGQLLAYGFT